MADSVKPDASPALPPFPPKDANGNRKLDGAEVLAILKQEDEAKDKPGYDPLKWPSLHGVLIHLGIRDIAAGYETVKSQTVANSPPRRSMDQDVVKMVRQMLSDGKDGAVTYLLDPKNVAYDGSILKQNAATPLAQMDLQSAVAYAKAFKATYPEGINISDNDALQILDHFAADIRLPAKISRAKER